MKLNWKSLGLATALAASALSASAPAMARDYYDRGGNDAAIAIGAGVIGLALGAALADRDDGRYYDRGYYGSRRYVTVRDRPGYYYYYQGAPNRYYRDRYYDRYYAPYYRERWGGRDRWRDGRHAWRDDRRGWRDDRNRWDRGRDGWRGDRRHDDYRRDDHRRDDHRRDWRR
ncbi:hypothetical protein EDF58_102485 [Novosphingobium sp. PhB57]|uniref:hypothetical protein n=1 Tax=Novosphingobium sp. PhB57 TaxID=2485107 RepID=UPI00104FA845|nr:hypothetical protein [Novosphingobium sp. PhB57]TCU59798.1 hypothetical protein EDF58_102485 [Novosphingobium sp. PhB57]